MDNGDVKIEYREKKKHKILVVTIVFDAILLFLFFVKIVAIVQFFIDNSDYQSIDLMNNWTWNCENLCGCYKSCVY